MKPTPHPALTLAELAELDCAVRPRKLDPHPCIERCWRIGAGSDLDGDGRCLECGMTSMRNTAPTCMLPRETVLALLSMAREHMRLVSQLEHLTEVGCVGGLPPNLNAIDSAAIATGWTPDSEVENE